LPSAAVNGLKVEYELVGEGDPVALTPGGRFSKDVAGVRELALALAEGGRQVLIWDRPNTGASDLCLEGESEFEMHADALAGLIGELGLGPTAIVGGSAGSRLSLTTAIRHPETTAKLAVWWVSGGYFHFTAIAGYYYGDNWFAAKQGGMEAVAELPIWQETLAKNPANRERLLATDPEEFTARMEAWAPTLTAYADSPVLGLRREELATITAPTLVVRGSPTDFWHHRRTTEWLAELIDGARIVDPPWGDEEWNERSEAFQRTGDNQLFAGWPRLAPLLLEFLGG
jgi:pimeloyl-ACP methyl ester carboxylesterase